MSIESKHAYRFGYLKSEKWQIVRLEALAREKAKCQICGVESISNDAHHIWYPESIYETEERHLVVLCRSCHNFIHIMMPECKTKNAEEGIANWLKFFNAVKIWRGAHHELFDGSYIGIECDFKVPASDLRVHMKKLRAQLDEKGKSENMVKKELVIKKLSPLVEFLESLKKDCE